MEPSNILEEGPSWKPRWKKGQQAKKHLFSKPILRSRTGSSRCKPELRKFEIRRQVPNNEDKFHKVCMAGNNQHFDNFTVMLGGCCLQKSVCPCLTLVFLLASGPTKNHTTNFKLHVESLCKKGLSRLYAHCKNRTISRCSF